MEGFKNYVLLTKAVILARKLKPVSGAYKILASQCLKFCKTVIALKQTEYCFAQFIRCTVCVIGFDFVSIGGNKCDTYRYIGKPVISGIHIGIAFRLSDVFGIIFR